MNQTAIYPFPFGFLKIGYHKAVVASIQRVQYMEDCGERNPLTDLVYRQAMEYLQGERFAFDFAYTLHGTDFQTKVWQALCQIPYGETRTYAQIAEAVGKPTAYRAVGMANGQNPIIIVVPCHRVVGKNGMLTGYAGGLDMKQALLSVEHSNVCKQRVE